jgi:thiopeptide-type bacteriocin biosynthesis protein
MKGKFYPSQIIRLPALPTNFADAVDSSYLEQNPEGLVLASQNLYELVKQGSSGLELTLSRYYTRMCTRCTPYGLFATCGTAPDIIPVEIDKKTIKYGVSLDYLVLCKLVEVITKNEIVSPLLIIFPNSSVYDHYTEYRYIERTLKASQQEYHISSVAQTEILDDVLKLCRNQQIHYYELVDKISVRYLLSREQVRNYIDILIEEQVLTTGLEPKITGDGVLNNIISWIDTSIKFTRNPSVKHTGWITTSLTKSLQDIKSDTLKIKQSIDKVTNDIGRLTEEIKALQSILKDWKIEVSGDKVLHVDTIQHAKAADNKVSGHFNGINHVHRDILELLNFLRHINSHDAENWNMKDFADRFYSRYEEQEIPLSQALDVDAGIGYLEEYVSAHSPLIEEIKHHKDKTSHELKEVTSWKKQLYCETLYLGNREAEISDEDINNVRPKETVFPPSLAIIYRYVNNGYIYLDGIVSPSAVNLINRFTPASPEIQHIVNDITKAETDHNQDVVFAEILHLPEDRTGNIMFHKGSRQYEIPYLAQSRLPRSKQIPISDLYVSCHNGQIMLRSKKLNKRVIPTLSSAYNYRLSELPIFRFLCDLQGAGCSIPSNFSWGSLQANARFLPRVRYKKFILYPATWRFTKKDFVAFRHTREIRELFSKFCEFHEKWNLPRRLVYKDGDQELFIDIGQPVTVAAFWDLAKKKESILLSEYFEPDPNAVTDTDDQVYANQFMSFWINKEESYKKYERQQATEFPERSYFPGDQWVYFKIYSGQQIQDHILVNNIRNLVQVLENKALIKSWFFIRYNDPEPHLRLRFLATDPTHFAEVVDCANQEFNELKGSGIISSLQIDTYIREIERYQGRYIKQAEAFFHADSHACLEILNIIADQDPDFRWLSSLLSVDILLNELRYTVSDKLELLSNLRDSFREEYKVEKDVKLHIDRRYRIKRSKIEDFLSLRSSSQVAQKVQGVLKLRNLLCSNDLNLLGKLKEEGEQNALDSILTSVIHMIVNRIIPDNPRKHELLLYDFLCRHYRTVQAKKMNKRTALNKD